MMMYLTPVMVKENIASNGKLHNEQDNLKEGVLQMN
jgi:hypothetical protein